MKKARRWPGFFTRCGCSSWACRLLGAGLRARARLGRLLTGSCHFACPFVPLKQGTGIASPAVLKKPPSGLFSLITREAPLSLSTDFFRRARVELLASRARAERNRRARRVRRRGNDAWHDTS